jgi:hypothetical protein
MSNKKYNIIHTILPDAPHGYINFANISFLTPQKSEKTKFLDVVGFKVHNGYTIEDLANGDAKRIKEKNKNHDVFPIEMGKLYPWDDISKSEAIEYEDSRMDDLEKKRRENADKLKLMREQFKNEKCNFPVSTNGKRKKDAAEKIRNELYKKGKITRKEYELMQEKNKPLNEIKIEASERERLDNEATEAYATDYLDVNEEVPLKYGCISIFTPKNILNLKEPCFKIRGLFETEEDLNERVARLEKLNPKDKIYKFELGKWYVYSDSDLDGETLLKQLNYAMKCHLAALEVEEEEFLNRKEKMEAKAKEESENKKQTNLSKKERRKAKREDKKAKQQEEGVSGTSEITNDDYKNNVDTYKHTVHALREGEDNEHIRNLMNYLNDDELLGKYVTDTPTDRSNATVMEFNPGAESFQTCN